MCNQTNEVNKKQSNISEISWKVLLFCFGGSWKRLISCYTFGVNERVSVAAVVATSTTTTTLVKIVCKISVWKFLWWTQCVSVSRVFSVGNSINYHQYGYSCGDGDGDATAVGNHAPWSSRYALHFLYIQFRVFLENLKKIAKSKRTTTTITETHYATTSKQEDEGKKIMKWWW